MVILILGNTAYLASFTGCISISKALKTFPKTTFFKPFFIIYFSYRILLMRLTAYPQYILYLLPAIYGEKLSLISIYDFIVLGSLGILPRALLIWNKQMGTGRNIYMPLMLRGGAALRDP